MTMVRGVAIMSYLILFNVLKHLSGSAVTIKEVRIIIIFVSFTDLGNSDIGLLFTMNSYKFATFKIL